MALDWLLAVLNVALTYAFVVRYGLVGAALGTSLAIAVQNAIQVILLRRFEGLWPFDRTYLTPLVAGGVTFLAMRAIREVAPGEPRSSSGPRAGSWSTRARYTSSALIPETGSSHESLRGGTVGPSPSGSVGKLRANRWSATGYASESAEADRDSRRAQPASPRPGTARTLRAGGSERRSEARRGPLLRCRDSRRWRTRPTRYRAGARRRCQT